MKHLKGLFTACVALALTTSLHAGGEGWVTDFEAAKAQAAKEGKDLLIDFTGSDWCGWCIKLKKEVFVHDAFKEGVKDKFVLVELDFPRNKEKIPAETLEQNKALGKKYAVRGYPTILLTDAEGRPYAKTGYRRGGPDPYVTHLDELIAIKAKRDESMAAAAKAEGPEKAKALAAALQSMSIADAQVETFYGDVIEQIKASDPEDVSGYQKGLKQKERIAGFRDKLNGLARNRDMEGAIKLVDDTLAEGGFDPEETQRMIMTKAMICANMKKFDEALATIDKAIAANPEGENNANIQKMRERVAASKAKMEAAEKPKPDPEPEEEAVKEAPEKLPKEAIEAPIRARDK